jgi:uncharacterized protein involved in outer membrane biogenesis
MAKENNIIMDVINKVIGIIKKSVKLIGIVVVGLIFIILIAAIVVPIFLPLDKIKDMAAESASSAIHRQVKIGKVSFNIFKGIELRDLSISNRPGFSSEPFVSAGLIELKYDLFALLRGKIAVDKIVLVKPEILIESRNGVSNYSDMVGIKKPVPAKVVKEEPKAGKKKVSVTIMVSKFQIKNAKLTMANYTDEGKKITQLKDLNVNVTNITLNTKKPINLSIGVTGVYEGKEVPISVDGNIWLNIDKSQVKISDLLISAAGEKLTLNADIANFDKAPNIKLDVSSQRLDVDKFLAIVSGSGSKKPKAKAAPLPYGTQTRNINRSLKSIPSNIRVAANISLNNILFKEMKLDSIKTAITLANKVVDINVLGLNAYKGKITGKVNADLNVSGIAYSVDNLSGRGFNANPASNDFVESFLTKLPDYKDLKGKLDGELSFKLNLTGRGVETQDIIANANGNGSFLLANGRLGKLNSLSSIGSKIGLKMFDNDMELKEFKANFAVARKIVTITDLALNNGDSGDIKVGFKGSANISSLEFIRGNRLSLKLNPKSTQLADEYEPFKDENGWYSLEFEMTGSLKKPIPIPQLGKPVQQMIDNKKKEAEKAVQKAIDSKKKEAQDAAQKEIDRVKKEAEDKARQELEDKAKEMLKF